MRWMSKTVVALVSVAFVPSCARRNQAARHEGGGAAVNVPPRYCDIFDGWFGYPRYSLIFRPSTFKERLATLARIKEFEFTLQSFVPLVGDFTPMNGNVERVSAGFRFSQNASADQIRGLLSGFIDKHEPKSAKVYGEDKHGDEVVYRLFNDLDTFESFSFDHFVAKLDIDSNDLDGSLQKSAIADMMVAVADSKAVKALLNARAA